MLGTKSRQMHKLGPVTPPFTSFISEQTPVAKKIVLLPIWLDMTFQAAGRSAMEHSV